VADKSIGTDAEGVDDVEGEVGAGDFEPQPAAIKMAAKRRRNTERLMKPSRNRRLPIRSLAL
jgi:hypothetical protein